MKWINWKLFNLALWVELALSLVLPFRVVEQQYRIGFPLLFLTAYDKPLSASPLLSLHLNPLILLVDVVLLYLLICGLQKGAQAWRNRKNPKR